MTTGTLAEKLKIKKGKEEGCVVTVDIEVPVPVVQETSHNVWLQIQSQARLPGFRAGKAPLAMVQQAFAGEAQERVVHRLMQKAVPEALTSLKLDPVASPSVTDVKYEPGKPLHFSVLVETAPKFDLKTYKKLKVDRKKYPATKEELDKRLGDLREGNARLEKAPQDAVAKDHYVVVDFQGSADGKPLKEMHGVDELVDMSSQQTVDGLVDGLVGAKRGETRTLAVKVDGKPVSLQVTVKEIKTKVLPALDDEFAKDLGLGSLEELRKNLTELIEKEGKAKSDREVTAQVEEGLLKNHKFAVPPTLAAEHLERLTARVQEQIIGPGRELPEDEAKKLREKLAPRAEDEIRLSYLFRAIAAAEKLEVSDADFQAELDKNLAEARTDDHKRGARKFFEEHKEEIRGMLRDRKVMTLLREQAAVTES